MSRRLLGRLFLYGTLQPAADTAVARWLSSRIVMAEPARAPGRLYAIPSPRGWFPALLPAPTRCHGTLVMAELTRGDLAKLDRYEGPEYRRTTIRALGPARSRTCSAYVWRTALPVRARPVAGGDFLAWLDQGGQRSYGA